MKLSKNFEEFLIIKNPQTIAGSGLCCRFEVTKQQTTMTNLHNSDQELWRDIPGYDGFYQASNFGRIKSLSRIVNSSISISGKRKTKERIIKLSNCRGYKQAALCKLGVVKEGKVHRLVAFAWLGESSLDVNHKDGNKSNNHIYNLEYVTKRENQHHAISIGRYKRTEVVCTKTGMVFESVTIAAKYLGLTRKTLCNKLHGRRFNNTSMKLYATNS